MIETMSLCPTCYKKIPALIKPEKGMAVMQKKCDVHGVFTSVVEKSWKHLSNFYKLGTLGNNNSIIIHIHDKCNMKCSWCYYGGSKESCMTTQAYDQLFRDLYGGYSLMLSGGEPTERPDYFEFVHDLHRRGWMPSTITNMINLADEGFFARTMNQSFIYGDNSYRFAMSFQHPKNYSSDILSKKTKALDNIRKAGLKAQCCVFSIQSLDELDFIKDFYDNTRDLYHLFRIRTMFNNWNNEGEKTMFLSELHDAVLEKFSDYSMVQSNKVEQSNIYCLYMETKYGQQFSLASAPNVQNIDYNICARPVYMLGPDLRCYPVPTAQIINEGINKGWKDGYKIMEEKLCLQS